MSPDMNVVMARITLGMMSSSQTRDIHQIDPPIPGFLVPIPLHPSTAHASTFLHSSRSLPHSLRIVWGSVEGLL